MQDSQYFALNFNLDFNVITDRYIKDLMTITTLITLKGLLLHLVSQDLQIIETLIMRWGRVMNIVTRLLILIPRVNLALPRERIFKVW